MDLAFPEEDWEMDKQQVYDSIIYSLNRDVTSANVQNLAIYFSNTSFISLLVEILFWTDSQLHEQSSTQLGIRMKSQLRSIGLFMTKLRP